jgi:predicted ATPase
MSDAGYSEPAVLDGIANLVEKSFVILNRSPSGSRWALPETIRTYALEKLVQSGQAEAIAERHAMCCSRLLEPAGT